jgi:hypothetical protein
MNEVGGRTRGTPNKSTTFMRTKLAEFGCDPVRELLNIARDPNTSVIQRVGIYSGFLRFTHPTPKPVSCEEENPTEEAQLTPEEALQWAHYVIDRFDPDSSPQSEEHAAQEPEMNEEPLEDDNGKTS